MNLDVLSELLEQRETLIADRGFYERDPEGHLEALKAVSAQLEVWEADHRSSLPPVLAHYLERRSYSKALAFCQGDETHRL